MSTFMAKPGDVPQLWHVVDGADQVVGRLAVAVARILMGKHRPEYTPHQDTGDFVVVVNADKLKFTGGKLETKEYKWFTGYPGGLKVRTAKEMLAKRPEEVLRLAVRRMLPKTKLARHMLTKLKIYAGPNHPHQAQQPKPLTLNI
jgi:large subunit ribosomal protein L13